MKLIKIIAFCLLAIALCFPAKVAAVKAYPFPLEIQQPDGESITIQLHGDEYFHYATTTDNRVIMQNKEGYYTFAEIKDSGKIVPGKIIVSNNTLKSNNSGFLKANSDEFIQKSIIPAQKRKLNKLVSKAAQNTAVTGEIRGLVILVNFKDVKFTGTNSAVSTAFTNMLNQAGYSENGATGSARDYLIDNSNEKFTPVFDVFGPVDLPEDMAFYGANDDDGYDVNPTQMVIDACVIAHNQFANLNFANYDYDGDQVVDNVFIFYAGYGENDTHEPNTVWPHQSFIGSKGLKINNVWIDSYACTSELKKSGKMCGIGTFTHEFGHAIGLPDFYDADYDTNGKGPGIGYWSIMDTGNYLNDGNTPPNYTVMERWMLGWLTPIDLTSRKSGEYSINPISSDQAYRINTPVANEYFLIENRKKNDLWDRYILGEGMLVYHVDQTTDKDKNIDYSGNTFTVSSLDLWDARTPNIIGNHQCFDLLRANNNISNYAGMPFPAGKTSLTDQTTPSLTTWNGSPSGIAITEISRDNLTGIVSFKLTNTLPTGSKENNVNYPLAFSENNIVCFKNITENTQLKIYNVNGNFFVNKKINESDCQEITIPGIYIVKLQTNNDVVTYKIIIK